MTHALSAVTIANNGFCLLDSVPDHGIKIRDEAFIVLTFVDAWLGLWFFWHENGATILVWQDGNIISVDLLRNIHDVKLIVSDERTQDRHGRHLIDGIDALDGLAGNLSEVIPGDDGLGVADISNSLSDTQHDTTHQRNAQVILTIHANGFLDARKRHKMNDDVTAKFADLLSQREHFLLSLLRGVWIRMKMDGFNNNTATHDRPHGDRAVDTAGKQRNGASASSEWKSAKAFIFLHVDIGFIKTDINVELHIVMLEVAGEIWKFVKDFFSHFELHIHGTYRKALVGTLHSDAETQVLTVELMHLADRCLDDRLFRKVAGCDRAVGRNAEDAI